MSRIQRPEALRIATRTAEQVGYDLARYASTVHQDGGGVYVRFDRTAPPDAERTLDDDHFTVHINPDGAAFLFRRHTRAGQ